VGEEVTVVYPDGNIDHPLILGGVYNGRHMPPWALPEQAALAGMRSRELGGGTRGNHLVLDDTQGKIQAQLKSDHQCSQLSLGHITRIEDTSGRKDARGEGFELRTDGHGIARAAMGMLITTEARPGARGPIKDMQETVRRLVAAHELHDAQASAALQGLAQESSQQDVVADTLKAQSEAVRGTGADFPELAQPYLVLSSPAGIATTTAQSTHIASSEHTALTTGRNLSITTGDSVYASIKQTFRLFVQKAGMKLVAAAGKITIQAHDDDIQIIANKVLSLISQTDWIDLRGKKGVRLHGAECMLEIGDLVQFFTSKPVLFHGNLETLGPKNMPQPTASEKPRIEPTQEQLYFVLQSHSADGMTLANVPYSLYQGETKIEDGITDDAGGITVPHQTGTPAYSIQLAGGDRLALKVSPAFAPDGSALHRTQMASNQGAREHEGDAAIE
jgi:type VI secretion system secreted protein VgrG